jgi:prophage regulatory protein
MNNPGNNQVTAKPSVSLLRLKQVLARYPVSKSHWYDGISAGKYPRPYKANGNFSFWASTDIDNLIESLINKSEVQQ